MIVFHLYPPQSNKFEKVTLYFSQINVGSGAGCHLKLNDSNLPRVAIRISASTEGLLAESVGQFPYKVNNKKVIGTKVVKMGDRIQLEGWSIAIEAVDPAQFNKPLNLEELYDNFHENKEEYEQILKALDKELILSDSPNKEKTP